MRKFWLLAVTLAMAIGPVTLLAGVLDSEVEIINQSAWDIHHLFLSSTSDSDWGPDQLGEDVIASGESFKLEDIPCDDYDVRIVDEDGDTCVIGGVGLCANDEAWKITDEDLLTCQVATDE